MLTTMDAAGRIVVPKAMREALGITDRTELDVTVDDGRIVISRQARRLDARRAAARRDGSAELAARGARGAAAGCAQAAGLLHAAGRGAVSDASLPPYRERAIALIRQHVATVDRFIAVSLYCATFMSELLEIPGARMDVVPLGISMKGYEPRKDKADADAFRVGYFARVAPRKGAARVLADAVHTLSAPHRGSARTGSKRPGIWRPTTRRI